MKKVFFLLLAFSVSCFSIFAQTPVVGNTADLPFTLDIEDVTQDELPGFHSMAFAQYDGRWVIIGGRVGGLHGFFPFTAFPENEANANIWVIDPETGDALSFGVDALTIPFVDQLKATNPQYTRDGDKLIICGGYGKEAASGNLITFPVLTVVNLPQLINAMDAHGNPSGAFRQIQSEKLRVCGGEMEKMGDFFYLVGGHDFSGNYTQQPSGMFTQVYTNEIRKFKISENGSALSLSDFSTIHDEANLHRRDFTLSPVIRPDGSQEICLFGGVFRPDADLPYYHPVYIGENQPIDLDESYDQIFSQYTCPTVPMFDSSDGSMYTIFFAGLSAHYYDQGTQKITYDERVPFIRDISTFRRKADGSTMEFLMPQKFDDLLGANMIFVPAESAPFYSNEVLKLHALQGKTFAGWLFGGILAAIPNLTPSSASKRMFKVYITPKNTVGVAEALTDEKLSIFPNPCFSRQKPLITAPQVNSLLVFNSAGELLGRFEHDLPGFEACMEAAVPGVYFIQGYSEKGVAFGKLLKM